jgi:hypothetical protein
VDIVLAETLPAAQLRHVEATAFGKYLPAPQLMQMLAPVVTEYAPAPQSAHVFHAAVVNDVNTPARMAGVLIHLCTTILMYRATTG